MTDELINLITLGNTDINIPRMGIGAWSWGDRIFWGFGRGYDENDIREAFDASINSGVNFVDTAEVYGRGRSERITGELIKSTEEPVIIATKFFPFPWRLIKRSLIRALRGSLKRLGVDHIDLYQIHSPFPPIAIETWSDALADAVDMGLTRAVGVSNFNTDQMRRAHGVLIKREILLASNQVAFSLMDRTIERDGLLDVCKELGVSVIAYSPLQQGILTGKYTPENQPTGIRSLRYPAKYLAAIQPLLRLMRNIGHAHDGKTPAQVALNWVISKGAIPIPGAKNARQARDNLGALGWSLSNDEVSALDEASDSLSET